VLSQRVATAVILLAVVVTALFLLPNHWWALVLLIPLVIALWEWGGLIGAQRWPRALLCVAGAACCALLWLALTAGSHAIVIAVLAVSVAFWAVAVPGCLSGRLPLPRAADAVAGLLATVPAWLALTLLQPRPWLLLMLLAVIWISDSAAYFAGRAYGRRKLAPSISPGKTWEGVAGALAAVTMYFVALWFIFLRAQPAAHFLREWVLFLAIAVLGVVGDLFESWIKRRAGVKDSGHWLPGHGGILDRIDALAAGMPLAALCYAAGRIFAG
jgi:phosphatidate cytidylyltransferase